MLQAVDRLIQRAWHPRHMVLRLRLIGVAGEHVGERKLALDTSNAGGERGGEGQVRVRVGARHAILDAQAAMLADDTQPAGTVVVAPADLPDDALLFGGLKDMVIRDVRPVRSEE